jgi:hypothetical protein
MGRTHDKVDVRVGEQGDVDAVVVAGVAACIYVYPDVALAG